MLWTQHHCGIWKSTDRGANWSEITTARPSSFGFAVVVHPRDADTAWFMPLVSDEKRVPVNGRSSRRARATAAQRSTCCNTGLPQRDAYDMVYRHGLDISRRRHASGRRLDDRIVVGVSGQRRIVADRRRQLAADLRGSIHLTFYACCAYLQPISASAFARAPDCAALSDDAIPSVDRL